MHPLTSFSITVIAGLSWRGHHRDIRDIWPLCHPWGCDTHRAHISKHHKIERESIVFRLSLPLSNSIGEQTQTGRLMGPWFNLVIELNWLNETKQLELLSNLEIFMHTIWMACFYGFFDDTDDIQMSNVRHLSRCRRHVTSRGERGNVLLWPSHCVCVEY